jgi:hypothetical protein
MGVLREHPARHPRRADRSGPADGQEHSPSANLRILPIALAVTGLTLVTSWGETEHTWASSTITGMAVGSAVLLVLFVLVELRAEEPMLPMRLFRSWVFPVASMLSFVVGFAMLGGIST